MPSEQVTGNLNLIISAEQGQALAKLAQVAQGMDFVKKKTKEAGEQAGKMGEQFERAMEHSLHHIARASGMSGLLLTGGAVGLGITALAEMGQKVVESMKAKVEEAKKLYEENIKDITKNATESASVKGINSDRSKRLGFNAEQTKIAGGIVQENRGISDDKLKEAVEEVEKLSPGVPGSEKTIGEYLKKGGSVKDIRTIIKDSQNNPEEVADFIKKQPKKISSEELRSRVYQFTQNEGTMDAEHAARGIKHDDKASQSRASYHYWEESHKPEVIDPALELAKLQKKNQEVPENGPEKKWRLERQLSEEKMISRARANFPESQGTDQEKQFRSHLGEDEGTFRNSMFKFLQGFMAHYNPEEAKTKTSAVIDFVEAAKDIRAGGEAMKEAASKTSAKTDASP